MARIRSVHPGLWSQKSRKSESGIWHLYLIQEGESGAVKVGIARNAFWRLSDLQSGNPRKLNMRAIWEADSRFDAASFEASVLHSFKGDRLTGEWLHAPWESIQRFLEAQNGQN
ncbi:GIY-YIG nuclease family protein [Acidiphilium angustum]|uniref:GIY-YIG nuclease family protein n=1 Tax=Acidiphilium angustum TaxID=523 RepID=UPI0012DD6D99